MKDLIDDVKQYFDIVKIQRYGVYMSNLPADKRSYHHGQLRTALLDAAEHELSVKGLERLSLRGVAKRAGVSHAAPAHHFGDISGLLTALAAVGFKRFVASQTQRQQQVSPEPMEQLVAAGLGYVDFALANPGLFRLMFSSDMPNKDDPEFAAHSTAAFNKLVDEVKRVNQVDPLTDHVAMTDVMSAWAMVHGLATLLTAGRMAYLQDMNTADREAVLSDSIRRTIKERRNHS